MLISGVSRSKILVVSLSLFFGWLGLQNHTLYKMGRHFFIWEFALYLTCKTGTLYRMYHGLFLVLFDHVFLYLSPSSTFPFCRVCPCASVGLWGTTFRAIYSYIYNV